VQRVAVTLQKMQQSDYSGLPFHERADRRALVLADDEIAFRKTEDGPGGPGVAEIALRDVAYWECPPGLLGTPWLLIEMCARPLVTDESAGCSTGAAIDRLNSNPRDGETARGSTTGPGIHRARHR
jgi:hypothetical protein